jgi:DHA1 family bicyclomycin/chloramphenicol resistance-like MFS transporter
MTGARLILLLTTAAALGQLTTSLYLPSFPEIRDDLATTLSAVQASLAVFFAGFAIGQILVGPLADWVGRKRVLVAGALAVTLGSVVAGAAPSIEWLIVGRLIQALGAAATQVASRAIARDLFEGAALGRIMATLAMAFAVVPGVAPMVGGLVDTAFGWRAVFVVPALVAVALMIGQRSLPESLAVAAPVTTIVAYFGRYGAVLQDREYLRFVGIGAGLFASLAAFLAGTPAVMIERVGVSPAEYGLYPALTIPGFIVGGILVRRFSGRISDLGFARRAAPLLIGGVALMLALPLGGFVARWTIVVPMAIFVAGLGLAFPSTAAGAMRRFPERAGAAAAMMGFLQMTTGAIASLLVGVLPIDQTVGFAAVMAMATTGAVVLVFLPSAATDPIASKS